MTSEEVIKHKLYGGEEAKNLEPVAANILSWILDSQDTGLSKQFDLTKVPSLTETYRY